ncbi:aspartate--ammonia ligase [uncultured Rikenella sp.]|uniref:aspartate--ammonia ligase n=1 Tax=uncultured Rikenella sp. TaxID=368003 RepID=UPI002614866D|nr:aspartate--ammonia ligase [uncultured Rikenella sp.]
MALYFPKNYRPRLVPETQEQAIKEIKDTFQTCLSAELGLRRVTAPLFVLSGTGINDDLNGVERAVGFPIKDMGEARAEVVQSLAKWKRIKLGAYQIAPGYGLYTDMNAIRADEQLDNLHSLYVDQWDWERTIRPEERTIAFLKHIVRKIYSVLLEVEQAVYRTHPHITPVLPETITFIHSQELLDRYPALSAKERENAIAKECGAVFIIGIGNKLSDGAPHDLRAPDYDDWITPNEEGFTGLNGDLILWNPVLESAYEISSMGIRVTPESLEQQLKASGKYDERKGLKYHRMLLDGELPLSIGGGIGQSRLCMFFLRCAHIGEVQASLWPEEMREACRAHNIELK